MRATTGALWSNTKVGLMMAGLTALLGLAGQALGGSTGLTLALGMAAAGNIAMYYGSSTLVMRSYRARVVSAEEAPALHAMVDQLRQRAGLPMPTVAIAPHAQPNAFATGRNERHAVVCVTRGLLDTLDHEQLEGVIAHELAHIRHRDMLLMTVTATLAGAIGNLGNMLMFSSLFGSREDDGPHPVAQVAFLLLAPIAAMLIQFAISRQREFRADAFAAQLTGRPRALASALQALEQGARRIPMAVSPTAAPLAQVNPLAAQGGGLAKLFSTHPPTAERVERLLALDGAW